jgi:hypothetical protein
MVCPWEMMMNEVRRDGQANLTHDDDEPAHHHQHPDDFPPPSPEQTHITLLFSSMEAHEVGETHPSLETSKIWSNVHVLLSLLNGIGQLNAIF